MDNDFVSAFFLGIIEMMLWMVGAVLLAIVYAILCLGRFSLAGGRWLVLGRPFRREARHIGRERNAAIKDILEIRRQTERRMRRIADEGVIEGKSRER